MSIEGVVKQIREFVAPIIASGRTRFLVTITALGAVVWIQRTDEITPAIQYAYVIAGIVAIYAISKILTDRYESRKK